MNQKIRTMLGRYGPIIVVVALAVNVALAAALYSFAVNGGVTVTAPSVQLQSATIGVLSCVLSSTSATCPTVNLAAGQQVLLTVVLHNNLGGSVGISAIPSSGSPSIMTIVALPGNAVSIAGFGTVSLGFTITAVATGSTSYSVAISG